MSSADISYYGVAVIAMAGRFPGAKNVDEFWRNLSQGIESISFFSDEELLTSGINPELLKNRDYVRARAILSDIDLFDAAFFGISPKEAEIMDPQHRVFLECAWEALELAGYDSLRYEGRIGVYAGVSMSTYFLNNLYSNPEILESLGATQILIANDRDYLPTRVSYLLNLRGPSFAVQSACSTSLVAVHLACQSLLHGECDMALAGGASINSAQKIGYLYQPGGIMSPDGHCRAFDAKAQGTVGGDGVGIVVLKRLEDALTDGDSIVAVIKGSAVNNDGSLKIGYTAPSVEGQSEVITEALGMAGFEADTVSYVEAHGTGTRLGDPIEIAALTQAFRASTDKVGFCAVGSVKTNLGHLDAAAGATGLIKTVLSLKHKQMLPSLHFRQPNPEIKFEDSPFYVNTKLKDWETNGIPRRAGVSSFGVGGTNAHVVLEEALAVERRGKSWPSNLLLLSAKTNPALEVATLNLAEHLSQHPDSDINDIAHTLQTGRREFRHRRALVCSSISDAVSALRSLDPQRVSTAFAATEARAVGFMFPGQGSQYVNMAAELYELLPAFREEVDNCSTILRPLLGFDLRRVVYSPAAEHKDASEKLKETATAQPALFVIEYALAKLYTECGIRPQAMIGHSIGEYVAACMAGVFSLEDALALVVTRGRLMQRLSAGSMLSVQLSAREVQPILEKDDRLSLAAVNAPSLCVISGPTEAIDSLAGELVNLGKPSRRLHTSHAFHSRMMDPILSEFNEQVRKRLLKPPRIPFISNLTGTWIRAEEATDPSYWTRHLRQTVLFADGVAELKKLELILLEVGPGRALSTFAKQQYRNSDDRRSVVSSMRHPNEERSDYESLLSALGNLWLGGVSVKWNGLYLNEHRFRVPLPTYPFERKRHWIEPRKHARAVAPAPEDHSDYSEMHARTRNRPVGEARNGGTRSYEAASHPAASAEHGERNETERTVAHIWEELLGVEQAGSHDDFFEMGGHSLLAIEVTARLRETFGVDIPIQSLFNARTVAALSALIEELKQGHQKEAARKYQSPLVPIQARGHERPFFCIHAIGGNVYSYFDLANQLGPDQPFYGLQSPGLNGECEPYESIEDMAIRYIEEIRTVQPEGPYLLGGWSMGGVIAFEMARRLRSEGLPVASLVLLDSPQPSLAPEQAQYDGDSAQLFAGFLVYLSRLFSKDVSFSLNDLRRLEQEQQKAYILQRAAEAGLDSAVGGAQAFQSQLKVFESNVRALAAYSPQKYPGRVVIFRAERNPVTSDETLGWEGFSSGPIEVHPVPGDHYTMLAKPNVRVLAECLKACLIRARQEYDPLMKTY